MQAIVRNSCGGGMIRKQCSRCVDVSVKFVGHDLHLSVARGRKLEFTAVGKGQGMDSLTTVSYTHLTLPTIYSV